MGHCASVHIIQLLECPGKIRVIQRAFLLPYQERVALTKVVPFKPVVPAETLKACALIGLHGSSSTCGVFSLELGGIPGLSGPKCPLWKDDVPCSAGEVTFGREVIGQDWSIEVVHCADAAVQRVGVVFKRLTCDIVRGVGKCNEPCFFEKVNSSPAPIHVLPSRIRTVEGNLTCPRCRIMELRQDSSSEKIAKRDEINHLQALRSPCRHLTIVVLSSDRVVDVGEAAGFNHLR